jgi:hypothetical protein
MDMKKMKSILEMVNNDMDIADVYGVWTDYRDYFYKFLLEKAEMDGATVMEFVDKKNIAPLLNYKDFEIGETIYGDKPKWEIAYKIMKFVKQEFGKS